MTQCQAPKHEVPAYQYTTTPQATSPLQSELPTGNPTHYYSPGPGVLIAAGTWHLARARAPVSHQCSRARVRERPAAASMECGRMVRLAWPARARSRRAPGKEAAEPVRCRKTTGRADSAAGRARPRRRLPPPGRVLSLARIRSRSAGSGAPAGTGRRRRSTATLTATGDRSVAPRNAELTCRACTAYGVPAEMCSGKLRSVSGSVFHRPGPRIVNN